MSETPIVKVDWPKAPPDTVESVVAEFRRLPVSMVRHDGLALLDRILTAHRAAMERALEEPGLIEVQTALDDHIDGLPALHNFIANRKRKLLP